MLQHPAEEPSRYAAEIEWANEQLVRTLYRASAAEATLAEARRTDADTGLPNRVALLERLHADMRAQKDSGVPVALFVVGLTRLPAVRAAFGVDAADAMARAVGERLRACLRGADLVARLAADEFAVAARLQRAGDAGTVARKLAQALDEPLALPAGAVPLAAAIGIALCPQDATQPQALLAQASAAMAHARERGTGVPQFFRPELAARAERTVRLEAELQQALARDEFCLLLQPRYAIASRRLTGAEALLRWRHPSRGLLGPEEFLDVAQASGLIVPIGARVLAQACRQAARWTAPLPVAVNLSPREFGGASIVPAVARALNEAGLPAARLQVEIDAASLLAPEAERAADTVLRLQEAGVRVLLDRAGAEVPAALRVAPFDGVKLDGALLRAALTEPRTAQVVTALARLARRLGARVIASSVETKAQLALARRVGCTEAQGFLLGAPIAPESFSVVARGQHAMQEKHASARKDHHPKPRADATHRRQFKSPQTEAGGACADSQHMQHICEVRGESD